MDNFCKLNEKERIEWLVDRLMAAEEGRDNALDKLEEVQLENLSLRAKLHAISLILDGETYLSEDEENDISNAADQFFGANEDLF